MASESHSERPDAELSHLDESGNAHMVNVGAKDITNRQAVARATVRMSAATAQVIAAGDAEKGDVLAVARIAGIQAAKKTPDLIPLCHGLVLSAVSVSFQVGPDRVDIEAVAETVDRTGVEMEALTACAVAGLTIYDMCKAIDKDMVLGDVALWKKTGGRSGTWERDPNA